jgi:hypothetical protein
MERDQNKIAENLVKLRRANGEMQKEIENHVTQTQEDHVANIIQGYSRGSKTYGSVGFQR